MPIYDRPTKTLMYEFAQEMLRPGQVFSAGDAVQWFSRKYPDIKSNTVSMHVKGMAVNDPSRKHHPSIYAGSGHDLFFKVGRGQFRLWNADLDPPPKYGDAFDEQTEPGEDERQTAESQDRQDEQAGSAEFSLESHLRDYLSRNLNVIGPGLKLHEEEGLRGVEFAVGGRFIDLLARSTDGGFVVIELKVSKGYDRVVGQVLRYMGWVREHLAEGRPVRGVVVASKITDDLKLAASCIPDVALMEYSLSFAVRPVALSS